MALCGEMDMKKQVTTLLMACMVVLCGCSKAQSPEVVETPSASESEIPSTQAPDGNAPALSELKAKNVEPPSLSPDAELDAKAWSDASNSFSLNFLRATGSNLSNTVLSAYSVERAMGMVLEGARGETANQMRATLRMPASDNLGEMGYNVEQMLLYSIGNEGALHIDNKLWLEKSYALLDTYTSRMKSSYPAEINQVDYIHAPDESRQTINASVAQSTMDKIQEILPAGSITTTTRLVLTNAIYFKAPWKDSFDANATKKEDFKTSKGPVQVDMMFHTKTHPVYQAENYTAVALPFAGSSYYLAVILPDLADGVDVNEALVKVENSLNAETLRKINDEFSPNMVKLKMPKFRVEFGASLRSLLQGMGMVLPFGDSADFTGISGTDDLKISDVFHKAYIDIDEKGAEAAAATAVVMVTKSLIRPPLNEPLEITVDHPFTFALMDHETGTALFMGRIVNF